MSRTSQPYEKSRMIPFYLDFVQSSVHHYDLLNYAPLRTISRVLSFYIDNLNNNKPLSIYIYKSGQTITAQPNTQGFYPVLDYASTFAFLATSDGSTASATVFACNYLVPPGTWGPGANVVIPNPLPVSGSVSVDNFPANQDVTVSNFPASQPISGTVSVDNFPSGFNVNNFQVANNIGLATFTTNPATVTLYGSPGKLVLLHIGLAVTGGSGLNQVTFNDPGRSSFGGQIIRLPFGQPITDTILFSFSIPFNIISSITVGISSGVTGSIVVSAYLL